MLRRNKATRAKIDRKWSMYYIFRRSLQIWQQSIYNYTYTHKGFETMIATVCNMLYRPVKSAMLKNKTNACAVCFCLGFLRLFASDTSPKQIDRKGLGENRAGTRQPRRYLDEMYNHFKSYPADELKLEFDSCEVKSFDCLKILGVTIDDKSTFSKHISDSRKRTNQKVGVLIRLHNLIPCKDTTLQICHLTSLTYSDTPLLLSPSRTDKTRETRISISHV